MFLKKRIITKLRFFFETTKFFWKKLYFFWKKEIYSYSIASNNSGARIATIPGFSHTFPEAKLANIADSL